MKAKKLFRFAAISQFEHVFEFPEGMADKWETFFGNQQDLILELACGKGEYSVNLAKSFAHLSLLR